MKIGLSYDLKEAADVKPSVIDDAFEEYDSPETVELIATLLKRLGHSVVMLGGGRGFLDSIRCQQVDIVFNIAEGWGNYRSREAQVPSILEMLGIPYTGSDPQCLALCLDKPLTKTLAQVANVSTPKWRVIAEEGELCQISWDEIPFPAIIKPAYEGSSKGIRLDSIAPTPEQAAATVLRLLEGYHQPVMVEEFIAGDEVTIGLVGNSPPEVLGMMRILPRKREDYFVYSLEVKRDYQNLVDYECPARLGQEVIDKLKISSLRAFRAVGCRDFARLDFRVSPEGEAYLLEINPLPGLGWQSDLVIMALRLGWSQQQLIEAVLEAALERYRQCVFV